MVVGKCFYDSRFFLFGLLLCWFLKMCVVVMVVRFMLLLRKRIMFLVCFCMVLLLVVWVVLLWYYYCGVLLVGWVMGGILIWMVVGLLWEVEVGVV